MTQDPASVAAPAAPLDLDALRGLEAVLFLADEPVPAVALAEVVEADPADVEVALIGLAERFVADSRGVEIRQVAGGWRMYTSPAARVVVERWALAGRTGRLTQAALETLAVIAYKQPIGRQEIGDIRGVNADGAVRSLVARGLVEEVGRDGGPGQAALFGTTSLLLERLGLNTLDELPPLTDYLPESPAPDEPELGTLKEIRRRLAAGGDLATRDLGGRSDRETNTGSGRARDAGGDDLDEDEDTLPPPTASVGSGRVGRDMDDLTDRLEHAARKAVERLRTSLTASSSGEDADPDADAEHDDAGEDAVRRHVGEDAAGDDEGRHDG